MIDVTLSEELPEGVKRLAMLLREGLRRGTIDPFCRRILAQDGSVKNEGDRGFTPEELLDMDWLCENVTGSIPKYEELLPYSRGMVKLLGVYPQESEV